MPKTPTTTNNGAPAAKNIPVSHIVSFIAFSVVARSE